MFLMTVISPTYTTTTIMFTFGKNPGIESSAQKCNDSLSLLDFAAATNKKMSLEWNMEKKFLFSKHKSNWDEFNWKIRLQLFKGKKRYKRGYLNSSSADGVEFQIKLAGNCIAQTIRWNSTK